MRQSPSTQYIPGDQVINIIKRHQDEIENLNNEIDQLNNDCKYSRTRREYESPSKYDDNKL